ncbi:hypothetical protein ACS0TY_003814 [Phlomoides rotata]
MGSWGESRWEWNWMWRRGLRSSEQVLLNELVLYLSRVTLRRGEGDVWHWRHSRNGLFSTVTAYQNLRQQNVAKSDEQKLYQRSISCGRVMLQEDTKP